MAHETMLAPAPRLRRFRAGVAGERSALMRPSFPERRGRRKAVGERPAGRPPLFVGAGWLVTGWFMSIIE